MSVSGTALERVLDARLKLSPLSVDHFSALRHLHASAMRAQTVGVLSDAEMAAFVRLVYSPEYVLIVEKEETFGAWLDDELVGTVSWQANAASGLIARLGCIFVRHPGHGIGRRLLSAAETKAKQCGFGRIAVGVTANAVTFFERQGYVVASRGVKVLAPTCALPVTFLRKTLPLPRSSTMLN